MHLTSKLTDDLNGELSINHFPFDKAQSKEPKTKNIAQMHKETERICKSIQCETVKSDADCLFCIIFVIFLML